MPDSALHTTELQFSRLLKAASGAQGVNLRFYSLPDVPRGEHTRTYMDTFYEPFETMFERGLDGLIVTGAEPRAEDLSGEVYWNRLTQVIDWADAHLAGSYWSCLAAHAAVRRLDGVRRVRLPAKCSGVFESAPLADDRLLAHLPATLHTPHSRLNTLDEAELVSRGYTILTRSAEAGVDLFARRGRGLMLFSQGHPEYDAETLMREFCRDVGRYLDGRRDVPPETPAHYLNLKTRRALAGLALRAPDAALMARYNAIAATVRPKKVWRATAVTLFRNWLSQIAANRTGAARQAMSASPAFGDGLAEAPRPVAP